MLMSWDWEAICKVLFAAAILVLVANWLAEHRR